MFRRFLENHFLANVTFLIVLVVGSLAYLHLPRQQDPTVNLNWVRVETFMPGASAHDIEKQVTDILEEAVDRVSDIRFITSISRQDISSIRMRFADLGQREFDSRVSDLRREIQTAEGELPAEATRPRITVATSADIFPTATILVIGTDEDETLRFQAQRIKRDFERLLAVERVEAVGEREPELQVLFEPKDLVGLGITPTTLAETVNTYFRDLSAGRLKLDDQEWLIRLSGTDNNPEYLANLPILTEHGEVPLRSVANVERGRESATHLLRHENQPAVMLRVFKKADVNSLELIEYLKEYIDDHNQRLGTATGVRLHLLDDQTFMIRDAINKMQRNAMFGLLLVLVTIWLFLGARTAFISSLSILFVLAGTFIFLGLIGQTLNVIVLLALIISLGMLVDDTVVVAEAIHYRLQRGMSGVEAALQALREVAAPVTAAVLTTIAAFLPLMLVPGVLGEFMRVAPLVVAVALLLSLIEAFWIIPGHVIASRPDSQAVPGTRNFRQRSIHQIRRQYSHVLVAALRRPKTTLTLAVGLLLFALGIVATGVVRTEFFASDFARLFYVNVTMPAGTSLEKTLDTAMDVEDALADEFVPGELYSKATYAGVRYTDTEPLYGRHQGQILASLHPQASDGRSVDDIIEAMRTPVQEVPGPVNVSFTRVITGAPPASKPIHIKVLGDEPQEIRAAADRILEILNGIDAVQEVIDDEDAGRMELSVRLNPDAIMRAQLDPANVIRDLRLLTDGEVVASMRDRGETLRVRVRTPPETVKDIDSFLNYSISLPDGSTIPLRQLLHHDVNRSEGAIRHYNLQRVVTIEGDLDTSVMDTLSLNRLVTLQWNEALSSEFPGVDLDFSGDFDDIEESIQAIGLLFLFGLSLVYLILGTQFRSYIQPLIVLATVPMALTGVILGLWISQHPISVYTMYGVVALAGIALNDAIVLISAANDRIRHGLPVMQAAFYAARRRFVPIVITSVTTIAGLFSLAVGLGGESLMWGPLASAIVWGLMVSTILTLFIIPLVYGLVTRSVVTAP